MSEKQDGNVGDTPMDKKQYGSTTMDAANIFTIQVIGTSNLPLIAIVFFTTFPKLRSNFF